MRLYRVYRFAYSVSNSLLPPRDPEPDEEVPFQEASYFASREAVINALLYHELMTRVQAEHLYDAKFSQFWLENGLRPITTCSRMTMNWFHQYFNPIRDQIKEPLPLGLPPQAWYVIIASSIIIATLLIIAPDWDEEVFWYPSCNLYIGTYDSGLSFFCLAGVSEKGKAWYYKTAYIGSVIAARTYDYVAPPVPYDRFSFLGGLYSDCWVLPWFRRYRWNYAQTIFVGFLDNQGGGYYSLRDGGHDPWAPVGPMSVPWQDYCRANNICD